MVDPGQAFLIFMRPGKFLFLLFTLLPVLLSGQGLRIYSNALQGIPFWNNKGNAYVKNYGGLMIRAFAENEKKSHFGFHLSFETAETKPEEVMKSLDAPEDIFHRTAAYATAFHLGALIMRQKKWGEHFEWTYGSSLGFTLAYRNAFEEKYYPADPVLAGYSENTIRVYHDGFLSGYGYFVMPYADLTYFPKWKELEDFGLCLGLHGYFRDAQLRSNYASRPNSQAEFSVTTIKERAMIFGAGLQLGFVCVL